MKEHHQQRRKVVDWLNEWMNEGKGKGEYKHQRSNIWTKSNQLEIKSKLAIQYLPIISKEDRNNTKKFDKRGNERYNKTKHNEGMIVK